MTTFRRNIAAIAITAALGACASTPSTPPVALEQARSAYQSAKSNPHVPRFAPEALNQAGRSLDEAERLWTRGEDAEDVAHQAYLAKQQARIAAETAAARAARSEIEQADTERNNVIARARTQQLTQQQQQAEAAARSAEIRAEEARQQALTEQQRAEQQIKRLESQLENLKAEQTNQGWVLTLGGDVLFDVGKSELKPGAFRSITQIAQFLQANPERSIVVSGYTDNTGSEHLNLELSQRRAQAVKQALVARSIDPNRIQVQAFGEAYPVASNDTSAGRQLNRRVEVMIPNMPQEPRRAALN